MEKTLSVSTYTKRDGDKVISVSHTFELDMRKSCFYASKSEREGYKNEVKRIHDKIKSASTYVGTSLSFNEIDWYSSETNMYEVPYYGIKKGNRSVNVGSNMEGSIPKDWEQVTEVTFKNPKQYGAVLKAVEALGYTLDATEVKDLKKALKDGYEFEKFVEVQQRRTYW